MSPADPANPSADRAFTDQCVRGGQGFERAGERCFLFINHGSDLLFSSVSDNV
jgi:hypothetical protein